VTGSPTESKRLRHGYTNATTVEGPRVVKRLHGDFGPQNMLFDEGTTQMAALVDWEFTHAGDPVEDLAWAEWIVRTHQPHLAKAVDLLFDGYGHRPTWQRRQNAMLDKCRWALDFVRRWPEINATSVEMWEQRLEATARFRE
jgi:aminoglycoside phosphotransferase (APT) family kinase protein